MNWRKEKQIQLAIHLTRWTWMIQAGAFHVESNQLADMFEVESSRKGNDSSVISSSTGRNRSISFFLLKSKVRRLLFELGQFPEAFGLLRPVLVDAPFQFGHVQTAPGNHSGRKRKLKKKISRSIVLDSLHRQNEMRLKKWNWNNDPLKLLFEILIFLLTKSDQNLEKTRFSTQGKIWGDSWLFTMSNNNVIQWLIATGD